MARAQTDIVAWNTSNGIVTAFSLVLAYVLMLGGVSRAVCQPGPGANEKVGEQQLAPLPAVASPSDWPGWRGSDGLGMRTEALGAMKWSASKGVLWKTVVPGEGHSSPIIFGDQVFLSTADARNQTLSLFAYHRKTGAKQWNTEFYRGGFMGKHQKNSHASATPVCDGIHVYVPYIANGSLWLSAIDLKGNTAWQRRLGPFVSEWGYASSPTLYKDLVIVVGDNKGAAEDNDAAETSYLVALNRRTGEPAWRTPRPLMPSYGTPVVVSVAGRDQILLSGAEKIVGYDPADGKELWFYRWGAFRSANSMVCGPNCVYASTTYPNDQIVCVRADGTGDVTNTHLVWKHGRSVTDIPSLLYHDGRLYLTTDQGMAVCMDGATGKTIWRERLGGPISASPVRAGEAILSTDEQGTTHIFKAEPRFEVLATNALNDGVLASPALSGSHIFLRSRGFLYCLDGLSPGPVATLNVPPNPPSSRPKEQPTIPKGRAAPEAQDEGIPWWFWVAAAILGLLTVVILIVMLVLLVFDKHRPANETAPVKSKKTSKTTPAPMVLFHCGACGKKLKVKSQLAGKKVKCPHCGKASLVPRDTKTGNG